MADDDLRDLLFFWFLLECRQCGRIEEFTDVKKQVDFNNREWAWEFANRAVIPARASGWTAGLDNRGYPEAICSACSAPNCR